MFKSLNYIPNSKNKYLLIDSDFSVQISTDSRTIDLLLDMEISKEYIKRQLNVEANLALYYKWSCQQNLLDLDQIINYELITYPKKAKKFFDKYLPGIKKYMALL